MWIYMNSIKIPNSSHHATGFTICHIQCIYCFWKCYIYMYKLIWYLWVNINYFRFVYHGSANLMVGKFVFLLDSINDKNRFFKDLLGLCTLKRFLHVCLGTFYIDLIVGQTKCSELFKPPRSNFPNSPEKAIYKNLIYLSRYILNKYMWTHIYIYLSYICAYVSFNKMASFYNLLFHFI